MSAPLPSPPSEPSPARRELTSISVWFFAGIGAVLLVLAAIVTFRSSGGVSWLGAAIGLGAGAALIAIGELLGAKYPITAKTLDGAGIGILYATLYSMHARWGVVPLTVAFAAMIVVTIAAVYLAIRRDSLFIAVLGLLGGFASAYLLASNGDYPLPVFAYLLALNVGIAALAVRKGWWLLSALGIVLTAVYEWGWAQKALNFNSLLLVAVIFAVFAAVGTLPLWHSRRDDCPREYRWVAIAAAHLPLLFAIYIAWQPNYSAFYNVLFAFLLVVDAGLLGIVWRGGPKWLHAAGGVATLIVFIIWFRISFTPEAWPALLIWAVLFIVLYLIRVTPFAGLMFGIFIGIGIHEPEHWAAMVLTMFIMLGIVFFVAVKRGKPLVAAIAIGVSCIALMTLHPPLWTLVALHAILFAEIFVVAWISEWHVLAVLAVPFLVAMVITTYWRGEAWSQYSAVTLLLIAAIPYLLFVAYPLALGARAKTSVAPYTAAALASLVLFIIARTTVLAGWVALVESVLMAVLLWRALKLEPREPRVTLLLALVLAFSDIAIASLLPKPWAVTVFALGVVVMVWLFLRLRHPLLLLWATGLAAFVFFRLAFDADLFGVIWRIDHYPVRIYVAVYAVCAAAMFVAAFLIRFEQPLLQRVFSIACLFEFWFLLNLLIANCYHSSNGAVVFDFVTSQQAESVRYTIWWAVIATALLIVSFLIRWPAARGAALSLLIAAILKCFLIDLSHLTGPYLNASLIGLGLSLAVVGVVLQRRWVGKSYGLDVPVRT